MTSFAVSFTRGSTIDSSTIDNRDVTYGSTSVRISKALNLPWEQDCPVYAELTVSMMILGGFMGYSVGRMIRPW